VRDGRPRRPLPPDGHLQPADLRAKMAKIYGDVGPKVQRSMDNWRYDLTVSEFMSGQVKRTKR